MDKEEKTRRNVLLTIFYLNKLVETKMIAGRKYVITEKGFEIAMTLVENGERLTLDEITECMISLKLALKPDEVMPMAHMILAAQNEGISAMIEQADAYMNKRLTHENITDPAENEVFVFGSNLSGFHGGGAAKAAMKWGAVWGEGVGHFGRTYALPTKSEGITRTLTVEEIRPYADAFCEYAKAHPELRFLLTEVGCGLAGMTPEEVAPLFAGATMLDNVAMPRRFWDVLNDADAV